VCRDDEGSAAACFPELAVEQHGTFVVEPTQEACAQTSPQSGSAFNFWHPALVTMHVWLWYPNPAGIYASMDPLVHAFG
jgi:hypothetical protein